MIKRRDPSSYPKKEKIKWALVAALGMVLLGVGYSNFRPSSGGKNGLAGQPEPAQEADILNSLLPEKLSVESPEVLTAEPETANSLASPMIQNIFAFASRKDLPGIAPMDTPDEKEFVLKGTIMDGENSLAYINDEMIGLGESINDFTLIDISIDSATIKNGDEVITLLDKEDVINEIL